MSEHVHVITDANFSDSVAASSVPVLVDFWAPWCVPCKAIAPHVEAIAKEHSSSLKVGKVDIDENPEIAAKYGIRSIPTLMLFKNGQPVDQIVGALPRAKIEDMVRRHS